MCPHYGRDVPIVYRGTDARCSACGEPRSPLASRSVNLTGRASQVGGSLARGFGYALVVAGVLAGLFLWALLQAIFPAAYLGYVVGIPVALLAVTLGVFLLRGGKALRSSGDSAAKATREEAVRALAAHRGGTVTAKEVSAALAMSHDAADALLTSIATTEEGVAVDVDDDRGVVFRFRVPGEVAFTPSRVAPSPRAVDATAGEARDEAADLPRRVRF